MGNSSTIVDHYECKCEVHFSISPCRVQRIRCLETRNEKVPPEKHEKANACEHALQLEALTEQRAQMSAVEATARAKLFAATCRCRCDSGM